MEFALRLPKEWGLLLGGGSLEARFLLDVFFLPVAITGKK